MSPVKRSRRSFTNGLQQTRFAAESVYISHLFQHLVNAPPALLRSRVIDSWNGEVWRVGRHLVHNLRKETDDHALAVQLQGWAQTKDQLSSENFKRDFKISGATFLDELNDANERRVKFSDRIFVSRDARFVRFSEAFLENVPMKPIDTRWPRRCRQSDQKTRSYSGYSWGRQPEEEIGWTQTRSG